MKTRICLLILLITGFKLHAQQTEVIVQAGHTGAVKAILFEKNRNVLLSADVDGRLVQWDLDNGWQIGSFNTLVTGISSVCFSYDQKLLAVGGYDNSVTLIDYSSKKVLRRWMPFKYDVTSIAFSPNGNYLVATSKDFSLWMYDFKTGKEQRAVGEDDLAAVNFSPDSKLLYFGCRNGSIYKVETEKAFSTGNWQTVYKAANEITELQLSPDGKLLCYGTSGYIKDDKNIYGELGIIDVNGVHKLKANDFPMSMMAKYQSIHWTDNNSVLYSNKHDSLYSYNLNASSFANLGFAESSSYQYNPANRYLAIPSDDLIKIFRKSQTEPFLELQGKLAIPKKIWLLNDNSLAVEYNNGFKKWDLKTGRLKTLEDKIEDNEAEGGFTISHDGRFEARNERENIMMKDNKFPDNEKFSPGALNVISISSLFSNDDKYFAMLSPKRDLFVYKTGDVFEEVLALNLQLGTMGELEIPKIKFSKDGKYLALLSNSIFVFDLINKKQAYLLPATRSALFTDLDAVFDPVNNHLVSASSNVYSVEEKPTDTVNKELVYVPAGAISSNPFYLVKEPGVLKRWDLSNGKMVDSSIIQPDGYKIGDATALLLSGDAKKLYAGTSDNRVMIIDAASRKQIVSVKDHNDMVFSLQHLPAQKLLISASQDGTIKLRNDQTLEVVATLFALKNHGYIIVDSSNHYKRSRSGASGVIFRYNNLTFQPEQYDLYFNKPQVVLQNIGLASPNLIDMFSDLYNKKAAGIISTPISTVVNRQIKVDLINEDELPSVSSAKSANLKFKISAINTNATSIITTVNGVPQGNEASTQINVANGTSISKDVNISLGKGVNYVSIKAYDKNGFSSSEKNFKMIYKPAETIRPNLYIIAISVSNYKDSTMNLKYAAKDGNDFLSLWKKDGKKALGFPSQFGKVFDFALFNDRAVKENILALKDSLANTKEEDVVLLYLAGHGLLDTAYNFYFATHDIQFNNPTLRGISYTDLEGLLSNIKPQKKIMMIDACHSGAVDKSLIQTSTASAQTSGRRSSIKEYNYLGKETKDLGNTFEQMQEMFNSFNEHSGTIVISAAAGNSYALESDEWNNGVFTYALINGLKNKFADKNKDGDITIDELSAYVTLQVNELTKGKQKPTERQENTKNIFRIW